MFLSEDLLPNLECAFAEGLGLLVLAALAVEDGEVVESGGDGGMGLAEGLLADVQGFVEEIRGLLVFVLVAVDKGEDVEHRGDVRMVVSARLLQILQSLQGYKRHLLAETRWD